MGTLRTKTIEPATGSTLTLGASGDTVTVSSDSIKVNTFKDAGGNTLFTSDGAGTLSSVNSAFTGNGPVLISTATASGAANVSITSGIDGTYDEYMLVFTDIHPVYQNQQYLLFNGSTDGGSNYNVTKTTTVHFAEHSEADGVVSGYLPNQDLLQSTAFQQLTLQVGTASDVSAAGILHIFRPSSTTYAKHFYSRFASYYETGGVGANDVHVAGYFNTTSAVNALQFKVDVGNFDGVIQMYGIK